MTNVHNACGGISALHRKIHERTGTNFSEYSPLIVEYAARNIPIRKATFQDTIAKVYILTIHEKILVQEPDFVKSGATKMQKAPLTISISAGLSHGRPPI